MNSSELCGLWAQTLCPSLLQMYPMSHDRLTPQLGAGHSGISLPSLTNRTLTMCFLSCNVTDRIYIYWPCYHTPRYFEEVWHLGVTLNLPPNITEWPSPSDTVLYTTGPHTLTRVRIIREKDGSDSPGKAWGWGAFLRGSQETQSALGRPTPWAAGLTLPATPSFSLLPPRHPFGWSPGHLRSSWRVSLLPVPSHH